MPKPMYLQTHTFTDGDDKATSILSVMIKCITKRCGSGALQTASSIFQEVKDTENERSDRHWMNFVDLVYDQSRLDRLSYSHMVAIGNKIMDAQGNQEVQEASRATMHNMGITPKNRQV